MNQNDIDQTTMSTDDVSVLRVLLQTTKGISPVAGQPAYVPVEEDSTI